MLNSFKIFLLDKRYEIILKSFLQDPLKKSDKLHLSSENWQINSLGEVIERAMSFVWLWKACKRDM
jgi:hypothetical protein